jgi:hypothetical protein
MNLNSTWQQSVNMKSVNELLVLFMRQAQLERAMKQPGGARVIDEQELDAVRQKLAAFPEAMKRDVVVQDNDRV